MGFDMSVESWNPDEGNTDSATSAIDAEFLQRCIAVSRTEKLDDTTAEFDTDERSQFAPCMSLPASHWHELAEQLSADEIFHAIRFFTVAEQQISGWEGGDQSPVIALNKLLKQRGEPLSREQVMWVKSNTDNRFLPNGAIL